jgi:hypothetical protein
MTRLDDYRTALCVGFSEISDAELADILAQSRPDFVRFIVDHGLGPLWYERTGSVEFQESRRVAEALFGAQEHALREVASMLDESRIDYAVFKGAANRLLLYENPAVRACHDIDLLVRAGDRVRAAQILVAAGFRPRPEAISISRELVLSRRRVNIDLHWGLLREGRLSGDPTDEMLSRRRRVGGLWSLDHDDALFTLLVHPAFAKHLGGWDMGLHRVLDIVFWLRSMSSDWSVVCERLGRYGARTAAWATLRWVSLLSASHATGGLDGMLASIQPHRIRAAWIDHWLRNDLSARTSSRHWARLLGLTLMLHDSTGNSVRAFIGRYQAHRRRKEDLKAFGNLLGD